MAIWQNMVALASENELVVGKLQNNSEVLHEVFKEKLGSKDEISCLEFAEAAIQSKDKKQSIFDVSVVLGMKSGALWIFMGKMNTQWFILTNKIFPGKGSESNRKKFSSFEEIKPIFVLRTIILVKKGSKTVVKGFLSSGKRFKLTIGLETLKFKVNESIDNSEANSGSHYSFLEAESLEFGHSAFLLREDQKLVICRYKN